jgi:response regulator NasT
VVILTAFSQRDLVMRARDAGAMAFLVKPFTKADLVPAIEIAVSRFQEFSALESEVTNLKDRLEVRKLLDRAKGLLQAERGMTEAEAFRWIQKSSMDRRMTMRAVAEEVLQSAQPPAAKPAEGQAAAGGTAAGGTAAGGTAAGGTAAGGTAAGGGAAAGAAEAGTNESAGGKPGIGKPGAGKPGPGKPGAAEPGGSKAGPG